MESSFCQKDYVYRMPCSTTATYHHCRNSWKGTILEEDNIGFIKYFEIRKQEHEILQWMKRNLWVKEHPNSPCIPLPYITSYSIFPFPFLSRSWWITEENRREWEPRKKSMDKWDNKEAVGREITPCLSCLTCLPSLRLSYSILSL